MQARPRGTWLAAVNAVVLSWLAAVAASVVLLDPLGLPAWLPVHMLLLGAVSSAIFIWTEHFAVAVLHCAQPARWTAVARLAALNAGTIAVLAGRQAGTPAVLAAGAVVVLLAVAGHELVLWRMARRALGGPLAGLVGYYLAAGAALLAGGATGALLGTGVGGAAWHDRLFAAHVHLNVLGWVLLTVLGTLFMLWPVVLRTRLGAGTQPALRWCLRLAGPGLAVAVTGMLTGVRPVAVIGLAGYLAGVVVAVRPLLAAGRARLPHTGAGWQLAAGTGWLAVGVASDLVIVAVTPDGEALPARLAALGPVLLVGVIGQVLFGSLAHLLPVVTGGGPEAVRAAARTMERGWPVRVAALNLAVLLLVAPALPGLARTAGWWLVAVAALDVVGRASWLLSTVVSGRLSQQRRTSVGLAAGAAAGVVLTVLAVVVASTGAAPAETAVTVAGDGVREVEVELSGMRVRPSALTVADGVHLRLVVVNRDAQPHDLRLDTGDRTPLLGGGARAVLDVGPVTGEIDGWCTVAGHRAAGMTLRIQPGAAGPAGARGHGYHHGPPGNITVDPDGPLDLAAPFGAGFVPYPAALPPAPDTTLHRVELPVVERELEVAPGVRQRMWTFGGTAPGPVLRGKVGDVFEITLVNEGTLGHGIDFHASALAPQGPMRVLAPGQRLVYRFQALQAGIWLYHCSASPMLQHVGNGMYGAVIIDPPDLAPVDREYALVASELYLGEPGSPAQVTKLDAGTPDAWAFNGAAAGYAHAPLAAEVGERVRVWVLAAGPSSGVSYHVVGTHFDTVYKEGAWLLRPGDGSGAAQALDLAAAQGGFVELTFPEPGDYPFLDHQLRHADAGASGAFTVTG